MVLELSPDLEQRLNKIAQQNNCSVEELLTVYADDVEQSPPMPNTLQFLNISVAGIVIASLDGWFIYVNPTFQQMLGYTEEELTSQPYKVFVHPDDLNATSGAEETLESGKSVIHFENRYRTKDGSYRWLSWTSTVHEGYAYGVVLDVTKQKQTEQNLEDAVKQNERILEMMFNGFVIGDLAGNIVEVNSNYCKMLGYTRDELVQMNLMDLDVKMPFSQMEENAETIVIENITFVVETQQSHKDGHIVDIEINSIKYDDNRIAAFVRDITERNRLERQLRRNAQLYRGLVESQIDFVCRYTPDTILTYVNDAYCQFFGLPREELLGKSYLRITPSSEVETIKDRLEMVQRDAKPDVRILRNDNSSGRPRWIQWVDYGITDDDGHVVEIQAVGRDVTSLMETQQQLAEREQMLSTIFETVPIMLSQLDDAGNFMYVNQYWVDVLGWTLDEVQAHGNILTEIYPDEDYRKDVIKFIQSDELNWRDFKTQTRTGDVIDTSWTKVKLPTGGRLHIGQIITHRVELENQRVYAKRLELELEKEHELRMVKDRFVSLVTHEFRTPLAVMTTSLDLVLMYYQRLSTEQVTEKLDGIRYQIRRMVDLMEDALRFSKVKSGQMQIVVEDVDVLSLCENVIETFKAADIARHEIVLTGDTGIIQTDPSLFNLILSNLVSNAIKYSPAGQITISIMQKLDTWEFSVSDQGIGIPEEEIPNLFDPFYRATNALDLPGTGLGLSIVKDYVEIQGGNIAIESKSNVGTTITFTLPSINTVGV